MDCNDANDLMMKYMDSQLSESEAQKLNEHLKTCAVCAEDFKMYDKLLIDFSEDDIIEAPEDFVEAVMLKIKELEPVARKASNAVDSVLFTVWGAFSILFGIGFLVTMNREVIMNYLQSVPFFAGYINAITPVVNVATEYVGNIVTATQGFLSASVEAVVGYKWVFLVLFVLVGTAQVLINRRRNHSENKVGSR